MLEAKRKLDFSFLGVLVVIFLTAFVYKDSFYIALGGLIGAIATSITMEKDIRRTLKGTTGIWMNLAINMVFYTGALVLCSNINQVAFIFCVIGLLAYRNILLYIIGRK